MTNKRIVYKNEDGGVCIVVPTGEIPLEEVLTKDIPAGLAYEIVTTDEIPADRTFRGAWVLGDCCIEHDIDRCRDIAHNKRRVARSAEFAPHDEVIMKQIPGADAVAAEEARQEIRDKYAKIQSDIDAAVDVDEIKAVLEAQ